MSIKIRKYKLSNDRKMATPMLPDLYLVKPIRPKTIIDIISNLKYNESIEISKVKEE